MKELKDHKPEQTEVHALKQIKREVRHIGTLRPQRGQKVWEMDLTTRILKEAEYDKGSAVDFSKAIKGDLSVRGKLITKENHIYCVAINARNADKQFFKMLGLKYPKNAKPKLNEQVRPIPAT